MSKLLFINMLGHGHVNPTIGLVKEFINRGNQVTYIASEEFRTKIEKTGAKFKGYKNVFDMSNASKISNFINGNVNIENNKLLLKGIGTFKQIFEGTFKEIIEIVFNSKEKFDYIIYDSSFILGPEVGRILKIPAICSITTFASNGRTNFLSSHPSQFGSQIRQILNSSEDIAFARDLQEKYGIKSPSISSVLTGSGMINIVYTSKYFQPCGESFDKRYKSIGPSISDRKENIDLSLETGDKEKVIYISLGTIFNNSVEFYENCFKSFANMNAKIIMSVGKNIDINTFDSIPSNFIVRNYVPQLEILKHADLFITHGGMNSTNEGLYYNVPLIFIPQFADQPFVADRAAELGAGIVIEKDKVTPEVLKQSVTTILSDNNFKINSERIGKSLRKAGGYKKGVDEILSLAG